ncbi:MAG TPA: nucleoside hydrolase [Candidatus Limnocylindria bacterium]|nr:nucleoside hydrolase [Candidatus Limnocylindria bacterium]
MLLHPAPPSSALRAGLLAVILLLAACGAAAAPSDSPPSATPDQAAPQPVVIDTDLGADDLIALTLLLREPALDVRAVTVAATGLVHCEAGRQHLSNLFHQLQVEAVPVGCGRDDPGADGRKFPPEWRTAADAAYGLRMTPVAVGGDRPEAVDVLTRAIEDAGAPVTVVALGPWTNLEDLFAASPDLAASIELLHAMAGTVDAPGNVYDEDGAPLEPSLEWNVAADPSAFAAVQEIDVPIRLVSLDATDQVPIDQQLYERLDDDHTAAGANLAFELLTRNAFMLEGGTFLWDELAVLALLDPTLIGWESTPLTVDDAGHLARGGQRSMEVSMEVDPAAVTDALLATLTDGGPRADPFELDGILPVTWDGATCSMDADALAPGLYRLFFTNQSDQAAAAVLATVAPTHEWSELVDFLPKAQTGEEPPSWLAVTIYAGAEASSSASGIGEVGEGTAGPVCLTGDGTDVRAVAGDPIEIAP